MGLSDMFKVKEFKLKIHELEKENEELKKMLSPEMQKIINLNAEISNLTSIKENLMQEISDKKLESSSLDKFIMNKKNDIILLDEESLMQTFGLYTPMYNLMSSEEYKNKIAEVRNKQKLMIKNKTAVNYSKEWTINGSKAQGTKMTNNNIKQILRSFNNECEVIISKVKYNNIESIKKRINKAFEYLNKLNETSKVSLTTTYLSLKIQELNLCYEYELKKQEEKEEQKQIKEQMKEEQKVQKEIENMKQKIGKEEKHFSKEIEVLKKQLLDAASDEKSIYEDKLNELNNKLQLLEKDKKDVFNREQNTRAGYVYVISNIGSFGENVYKIGMTRRLEPLDRVNELGNASVPFAFDVHAMIFSEDAPKLESDLHNYFEKDKVNKVNSRKEFFNTSLSEIELVVKKYHNKTVEFTKLAQASEYRQSLLIAQKQTKKMA